MTIYTLAYLVSFVLALLGVFIPGRHLVAASAALTAAALLVESIGVGSR